MSAVPSTGGVRIFRSTPSDLETLAACPLCAAPAGDAAAVTRKGDRFEGERAALCRRCGLVFLNPRLRPEALARYYGSDRFSVEVRGGERPDPEALAYRDMRAARRWRLLEGRLALPPDAEPPSALEIGCGAGNFLRLLDAAGYRARGIDPSSGYAAHGKAQGLDVVVGHFPGDLPDREGDGGGEGDERGYDLVVMFHVLEHVPDPAAMLEDVRARLAPGGRFVLEYPDVELAARRRFLPPTYFERQHLFDFSRSTVGALLARAGLRVEDTLLDDPTPPWDRNVLLVCEAAEPTDPGVSRPREAAALERALRRRMRISEPLLPLRPLWKRLKGLRRLERPGRPG